MQTLTWSHHIHSDVYASIYITICNFNFIETLLCESEKKFVYSFFHRLQFFPWTLYNFVSCDILLDKVDFKIHEIVSIWHHPFNPTGYIVFIFHMLLIKKMMHKVKKEKI